VNYTSLHGRVFKNLKDEKDENFYQLQNYPLYAFQLKVFSDENSKMVRQGRIINFFGSGFTFKSWPYSQFIHAVSASRM